jgi:aspartate racemase
VLVSEQVPSRIDHLTGVGRSPVPSLCRAVRTLTAAGATVIVVPSATTHAYLPDMRAATDVPVLDLLAATGRAIGVGDRVLVLATKATVALRLFEPHLEWADVRYPDAAGQSIVDGLIDAVKRGEPLDRIRAALREFMSGLDPDLRVVLGCTELSVVSPAGSVVDTSEVLAISALAAVGLTARELADPKAVS